ncbi:MAG: UDP-N-acetylmuramoylalanyl-D-glutamate--2,6-diaminopimelate ligase, partial [Chloroflexi bacterium]|nr:UDP-N-acetylmuramoylalanyl-D-glutamate--2,6-diaminopimelate ligase [Chloroflexota bacterium]
MSGPAPSSIAELLAAAEPAGPRALGGLLDRLEAAGLLRSVADPTEPPEVARLRAIPVSGIAESSRAAEPWSLFSALRGDHLDGHDFLAAAGAAGATVALVEESRPGVPLVQVVVADGRRALAEAACWWYGDPSARVGVVGITGTDGKTITSYLAVAGLEAAGLPAGMTGTTAIRVGGRTEPNPEHVTTPSAPRLQRALAAMAAAGDAVAVVETSSHGLAQERVGGTAYDAAILTNLTHEHLEFHGTFEAYRAAKLSLFERLGAAGPAKPRPFPRLAVINADDPAAPLFVAAARSAEATVVRYGLGSTAEVRIRSIDDDGRRLRLVLATPGREIRLKLRLSGRFNAHNAAAVVALGAGWGLDLSAVGAGLETVDHVPGRMEWVDAGQPFGVVVDYAHSPAALAAVLDLLGPAARARGGGLIAVFGSAGERDVTKRPLMGQVAAERCRLVVLTDEDPRAEDRWAILEQIAAGAEAAGLRRGLGLLLVPDRR